VFTSRQEKIFCPWKLFNTPGNPVPVALDNVRMPVAPEAVDQIIWEKHGQLADLQPVRTRLVDCRSGSDMVLRGLYEVDLAELAAFLLFLGRRMNTGSVGGPADPIVTMDDESTVPAASDGDDGWITVRLSRLVLPPYCCGCGDPKITWHNLRTASFQFGLHQERTFDLPVPVCRTCRKEGRRRRWKHVVKGLAITTAGGIGLWFLSLILACAIVPNVVLLIAALIAVVVPVVMASRILATGYRCLAPIEARRFSPSRGTVQLRFRWREYGEWVLGGNPMMGRDRKAAEDVTIGEG
jgi:hypothetical protein